MMYQKKERREVQALQFDGTIESIQDSLIDVCALTDTASGVYILKCGQKPTDGMHKVQKLEVGMWRVKLETWCTFTDSEFRRDWIV